MLNTVPQWTNFYDTRLNYSANEKKIKIIRVRFEHLIVNSQFLCVSFISKTGEQTKR